MTDINLVSGSATYPYTSGSAIINNLSTAGFSGATAIVKIDELNNLVVESIPAGVAIGIVCPPGTKVFRWELKDSQNNF